MNDEQRRAAQAELDERRAALPPYEFPFPEDMTEKDRDDILEHHARMGIRYLVWYRTGSHGLFSSDVAHTLAEAQWNQGSYTEDGYPARILRVKVVDGDPVAEWVE